jgi:hypothetical protein
MNREVHVRMYVPSTVMLKTSLSDEVFPCCVRVWRIRRST